ncbi:MAG: alanine racemase [Gammaproteobacteria bacterium]|nr:alanine racemase [Gammaproteobacteria bacterium]
MSRPARALLDAGALRHNLQQVRLHAKRARVTAIVKANGYGHGLAWVARTLGESVDAFGVSSVEEGIQLRESGVTRPVCLLEGFFTVDELPLLSKKHLEPVIHHDGQLKALMKASPLLKLTAWIKVDTGMHRLGFAPAAVPEVVKQLRSASAVAGVRLLSHFARAEFPDDDVTRSQIDDFAGVSRNLGLETSLANSAGILAWPSSHLDWVRPGIMLYGASPLMDKDATALGLEPVMTLESALIAVHARKKGDAIGYGGDWRCPEDMPVGVAAIGYGDGYPRHAPPGTPVLVNGRRVPTVGRVSMDMITLDLRTQPQAKIGDPVVLWGRGLPVEEVAQSAGTVSYELLCHVTERIPRITVNRET